MERDSSLSRKKILFVINPISGTKPKDSLVQSIRQSLDGTEFDFRTVFTERPGHATELAEAAVIEGFDSVVAVGGDGTMNEVARALIYTDTALGIVPIGSGNGLARHLGIPVHVGKALQRVKEARTMTIDSCTLNDIPFFCTAGVGFDAHIGHVFAQHKRRGFAVYVQTTIQEFFNYKPDEYTIGIDGQNLRKKAFVISFANASQYGNNAYIAPQADIQDGMVDVCMVSPFPYRAFPDLGIRLFNRTLHMSSFVEIVRTQEVTLQGNGRLSIHLDGEPYQAEEVLKVKVKPMSLKVLV